MRAKHPLQADLALYSGHDLSAWQQWRVGRHLSSCSLCRREVEAYREGLTTIRKAAGGELPGHSNWPRLSQEMTGNIRVGFAAGECIAGFEKNIRPSGQRLLGHTALVLAGVFIVALASLWVRLPKEERSQLAANLERIRWQRMFKPLRPPALNQDLVVLEAGPSDIEVKANGRELRLMHPHSEGGTVSINMQDSAGVRYVDADSGQVTTNRVYYAQ